MRTWYICVFELFGITYYIRIFNVSCIMSTLFASVWNNNILVVMIILESNMRNKILRYQFTFPSEHWDGYVSIYNLSNYSSVKWTDLWSKRLLHILESLCLYQPKFVLTTLQNFLFVTCFIILFVWTCYSTDYNKKYFVYDNPILCSTRAISANALDAFQNIPANVTLHTFMKLSHINNTIIYSK